VEGRCVLCDQPIRTIMAATRPCPESIEGIALPCTEWREAFEQEPRGEQPLVPSMWASSQQSPPVPWRQLLSTPGVFWSLLFLVYLCVRELLVLLR
jgi:hypothetical protein